HKVKKVRGIIGADVLIRGKAIIDYANNILYLKRIT
ncbi:MAG: acid protease, partial [Pedobacter sp.]